MRASILAAVGNDSTLDYPCKVVDKIILCRIATQRSNVSVPDTRAGVPQPAKTSNLSLEVTLVVFHYIQCTVTQVQRKGLLQGA